ncbi:3-hydroxyisobutyryl-coenzyme A hydrolase [Plasmodium gonderi]|uniref:3-hydroxyisobutyryl-CoA hydrolase n=1 Tax=Plasmodium gonderi TaxID=77519 RepID=A0A1Y1JQJ9_PLAGO|nr:3-hydroxyisobutyryl-coenzyme A hydrolase [Plasmodium gonderi]GAW83775.1 3-hydroxyisobutyryl-coenzyme A hydrolase [Plasmodium gonderi]
MQKIGTCLYIGEVKYTRGAIHRFVKKTERNNLINPLFFVHNFCNKKTYQQKDLNSIVSYERKHNCRLCKGENNYSSINEKEKNEICFEKMKEKNNSGFHLIKQNISNGKNNCLNSTNKKGETKSCMNDINGMDIQNNGENLQMGAQNKITLDEIIDLELSDTWSKRTLILNFKNNIFEIILNRPEKLNAINKDMINGLLNIIKSLNNDDRCHMIIIRSVNTKCFCSGSDVKDIVQNKEKGMQHMKQLYMYINYMSKMKKAVLCIWNGYAMGGGLGISMYAKFRVINKNTIFAMPENKIGFFPDISCCYFFKKYFGRNIGLHLGLTSLRLNEADLVNFKICSNYIEDVDVLLNEFYNIKKTNQADFDTKLFHILSKYPPNKLNAETKPVLTQDLIDNINRYYNSANSLDDLINNLKKDEDNHFCLQTLNCISENCYSSAKLWFSYFLYNYDKPLEEVLDNDFKITQYFLYHTKTFEKGVTEMLVKKNKSFKWSSERENNDMPMEEGNVENILMNSSLMSIREEFI